MATDKVTENLVKFAYGTKANYSAERHAQYVYFATDTPLIHTKGMWRGVSKVILNGNMLEITTAEKDSDNSGSVTNVLTADLTAIACTATQRANWTTAYNFVKSITDDTNEPDNIINKWEEIVEFLAGIKGTTLQGIMDTKADKATKVFGYNGIKITKTDASGSVQSGDATLGSSFQVSIDNQMRGGTYTKVTVDDAGLVTVGQSLVESDIPTLSIGKISGLQAALNDKLPGSSEIGTLPPLSGGAPLNEEPTISLNYDGTTLVLGSDNKLKVGTISASQVTGLSNGYVPNTRQVIAGNGLTGGGALSADVTLSVKAYGNTISVTQNGISVLSAPKLSTARSLWGNSFDGTSGVSGSLIFLGSNQSQNASLGMEISSTYGGFIGFSKILGKDQPDGSIAGGFKGISLGWGKDPETDAASVRINDSIFTYKGNPIYYKGSTDFTTGVREIIAPELTSIANDFIAIGNRVTAVEKQLKWIEVS